MPRETIAQCARILAMDVAHYEAAYGPLALEDSIAMMNAEKASDEALKLLAIAMVTLAGVLALALGMEEQGGSGVH